MAKRMRLIVIDDTEATRNSILGRLSDRGIDAVSLELDEVEELADKIKDAKPDCVLVDFVLTESHRVRYRSHVLARVLRDRAIDGTGPEVPIVLYSSAPKFKEFYERDQTSHDLYDYKFDKERMQLDIDAAIRIMDGLAAAYQSLADSNRDRNTLITDLQRPEGLELDPRIGDRFASGARYPISELVGYTIRELIEQPYPLVDEALLAARLGLDLGKSPGAATLFAALPATALYCGICSGGFTRWWWQIVDTWLDSLCGRSFRVMPAAERVDTLREATKIAGLEPGQPICDTYQTAYWTVCEASHRPVDLTDAFIASNSSRESWHDHRYISLDAALRHAGEDQGVVVDAADEERFSQVRELLGG